MLDRLTLPKVLAVDVPHQSGAVRYALEVIDAHGAPVRRIAQKRNLILDQGLDFVAARNWVENMAYAVVGTGTAPVKRDSGAITFTRALAVVTASAGFFDGAGADIGRLLKFDTGEEMYIIAPAIDTTHANVSVSGALGASEGTLWYVNATGHGAETKRTGTLGTDSGDNGSAFVRPSWTMTRTFIFSAEAAPIIYNEIGWSWTNAAGGNLFGRDIITGGVSVGIGQQLKVILQFILTMSPDTPTAWVNVITGWAQDGVHCQEAALGVRYWSDTGALSGYTDLEPSAFGSYCMLSSTATALLNMSTNGPARSGDIGSWPSVKTLSTYVAGTRTRTRTTGWALGESNAVNIRRLVLTTAGQAQEGYAVLFNANQTKDSSHTLTLYWTMTWGRTLVN